MDFSYDVLCANSEEENSLPPIVFLHGLFDWKKSWKKVAPVIVRKTGRKAYAVDARNHGESSRSKEMNFDVLTEDLKEFLDILNIQRAVIIGHSMGGRTAINFALKYPSRVEALVIEDMTPGNVDYGPKTLVHKLFNLTLPLLHSIPPELDLETGRRYLLDAMLTFADRKFANVEKLRAHYDIDMVPLLKVGNIFQTACNLEAAKSMLESNSLVQNLPDSNLVFEGNALFLCGTKSFFKLERDSSVPKLFPRALIKRIEGASHVIHFESPDVFSELVSDFILYRNLQRSKY